MAVLICPECGSENFPGDEYCWACHAALSGVEPVSETGKDSSSDDHLDELLEPEEDLPGLLNALKQEGDIGGEPEDIQEEGPGEVSPSPDQDAPDQMNAEDEIPEWLRRIRQRAKQEKDSIGEVTQKISAAQDSLSDDKRSSQHENYAEWIERLRQESVQKPAPKSPDGGLSADEPGQAEDPGWLAKIRKVHGKPVDDQASQGFPPERFSGDSLLQWLVDLESGKEKLVPITEEDADTTDTAGVGSGEGVITKPAVDGDSTQEIRIKRQAASRPVLSVSRQEQFEADQLSATIVDESAARAVRKGETQGPAWVIRVAVATILITVLSFSLFSGATSSSRPASLKPQHQALFSWMEQLPAGSRLLLVADYHAGFDREISMMAEPILSKAVQGSPEIVLLASTESGVLLAEKMLQQIDGIENAAITRAGFFPAANFTAFGLGIGHDANWRLAFAPGNIAPLPQGSFAGVLVLSDSYEGGRIWIEQMDALLPDVPLNLITTAQAGPMLLPYYDSQQITGMVSGLSEARQINAYLNVENSTNNLWQAYRSGVLMMIIMIVLGLFFMTGQDRDVPNDSQGVNA